MQPCKAKAWRQMWSLCPSGGKYKVELNQFRWRYWCVELSFSIRSTMVSDGLSDIEWKEHTYIYIWQRTMWTVYLANYCKYLKIQSWPCCPHWGSGKRYSHPEKRHYRPMPAAHTKEQQGRHKHARGTDYTYSRAKMGKHGTRMTPISNFFHCLHCSAAASPSSLPYSLAVLILPPF